MPDKLCPCGSGLPRIEEVDGYGIYLFYACDKCRKEKLDKYRPDIKERYEADENIEPEE